MKPPIPITLKVLIVEQVGLQQIISLLERDSMRMVLEYISKETHGHHDRSSESPLCTQNNSLSNTRRPWDDVSHIPQYDKVIDWEDDLAAGSHSISPTNIATVSEETEILIKDACTIRLENANCLKINTYSLPQVATSWTPQLDNYLEPEIPAAAKTTDKELAVNRTHVLDALAPLSTIIET